MTKHVDPAAVKAVNVNPGTARPAAIRRANSSTACPATRTPACSAGCSRACAPLKVKDAALQALADAMLDANPADAGRQQPERPGRLHLSRPVRRPRHHARPDLARREGEGPARHRELPHAEPRSRLPSTASGPTAARTSTRATRRTATSTGRSSSSARTSTVRNFGGVTGDFRNDLPRSPEGFALIGDHRNDENLARRPDAPRVPEVPQQGRRHRSPAARTRPPTSSPRRAGSSPGTTSGWCCTTSSSA